MNWLLLRGLARDHRHWGDFPKLIESSLGAKVVCLDLPGAGSLSQTVMPATVAKATEIIRNEFLKHRESFSGPWNLLGVSLGGMIAMDWAARYSDFERAVIINSSSRDVAKPWERLNKDILPFFFASIAYQDPIEKERNVLKMTTNLLTDLNEKAQAWARYYETGPIMSLRNAGIQLVAASVFQSPETISTPLLFLASEQDQMVKAVCSKRLAEKFRAPLRIHPTAGHDLPLDDPMWVVNALKEFCNGTL